MPSRNTLELRAAKANVASATYPNDSVFEQAIIYAEKASTATSTATTKLTPALAAAGTAGGANV